MFSVKMQTHICSAGLRRGVVEVADSFVTAVHVQIVPQAVWGEDNEIKINQSSQIWFTFLGLWSSTSLK